MEDKNENPTRKLRTALGWNQTKFATALGLSLATIQNYERGVSPSESAIVKMQTLAASYGLVDEGFALDHKPFVVRKVIEPGHHVRAPNPRGNDLSDNLHDLLDRIMNAGNSSDIAALEAVLQALSQKRK